MTTDRDPMGSMMIRIDNAAHDLLDDAKIASTESYSDCISRLATENYVLKHIYVTTQTKEKMIEEMKDFVLNPEIPDVIDGRHRRIWQDAHPEYKLTPDDIIHHINGNHSDNRIENLERVDAATHAQRHAILTRMSHQKFGKSKKQ